MTAFFAKLDAGDLTAFDLFAPMFVHHRPLPGAADASRASARAAFARMRAEIGDMRHELESLRVLGDLVVLRVVHAGTRGDADPGLAVAPGRFARQLLMIYRFEGTSIVEEWLEELASFEPAPASARVRALSIGCHPDVPSPLSRLSPVEVRAGLDAAKARVDAAGRALDLLLLHDPVDDLGLLERVLCAQRYAAIVIDAGVRQEPKTLALFERLVDAVHRAAPGARIAFNANPAEIADAVLRVAPL
jgi:predicted ester cyclase